MGEEEVKRDEGRERVWIDVGRDGIWCRRPIHGKVSFLSSSRFSMSKVSEGGQSQKEEPKWYR